MKRKDIGVFLEYGFLLATCVIITRADRVEASSIMQKIAPAPYEVVLEEPQADPAAGQQETYLYPDIPVEIQETARKYGGQYGISPELIMAMTFYESSYNPEAKGGPCLGLMQVNPYWHQERMARLGVSEDGLFTVDGSIAVGTDYLAELAADTGNMAYALMKYNGDSRAEAYLACECRMSGYAERILRMEQELLAGKAAAEAMVYGAE